jgi:hypothetical protein
MDIRPSDIADGEEMIPFRCPIDNSLILRYSKNTVGIVEGKCKRCHEIFTRELPQKQNMKQ